MTTDKKFRAGHDSVIDLLQDMIANEVKDETIAHAILAYMADHPDSVSTSDFCHWADGETAVSAARKMMLCGFDSIPVDDWIDDDELDDFVDYAGEHFGLEILAGEHYLERDE